MNNMEIKVSVKDIPEVIEQLQKAEEKINNLQFKIDKAIELIKENKDQVDWLHMPAWELEDILKEDKIEEIPQFKGTTEQLNRLSILKEDK